MRVLAEPTIRKAVTFVSRFEHVGTGSPEGVVAAPLGATYRRTDPGAFPKLYVKNADDGLSSGWVAAY